ncbi:hypothetical protein GQ44DRAFT_328846 [Phaeosphaeriaceae sp. PMI808]|nr:hypothetical protein GQ44DRAFT_328846 [Phaeosphaeriaceae sp. PMI808]
MNSDALIQKIVAPTYQMAFIEDATALEINKRRQEQKRMNANRPGTEPWTIFRFHYRSQETLTENNLRVTSTRPAKLTREQSLFPTFWYSSLSLHLQLAWDATNMVIV